MTSEYHSENMNNNEFLPGCYTDLTFEAESGSIHSAPNRKSQDFFQRISLVKRLVYPSRAQTTEIL